MDLAVASYLHRYCNPSSFLSTSVLIGGYGATPALTISASNSRDLDVDVASAQASPLSATRTCLRTCCPEPGTECMHAGTRGSRTRGSARTLSTVSPTTAVTRSRPKVNFVRCSGQY
eukprot:1147880-Rhodomonas_salina.2